MTQTTLKKGFQEFFKEDPEYYIDTGGRFEIIGNHTDHNYGLCLVANCSLRCKASLKLDDNQVIIKSKGYKDFRFSLADLSLKTKEYGTTIALAKGTLARLKELGYKIGGFKAYIESDIPNGSGVSSSAAIESLFGYIINYLYNDNKITPLIIAQTGQYAENVYFNKPCGLLDQIGTSFPSSNFIIFYDPKNPIVSTIDFNLPLTLYLIKSLGDHSALTPLYSAIKDNMHLVAKKLEDVDHLGEIKDINNILERIDALDIKEKAKKDGKHFFIENENVLVAKKALEEEDLESFLSAIRASQKTSNENIENTYVRGEYEGSPQDIVDTLTPLINNSGAIRLHGGGFKGTTLAFIKNEFVPEFDEILKKHYSSDRYFKVAISSNACNFKKY